MRHMDREQRVDLHTHTFLSDGALVPSDHVRQAVVLGYGAIAITDHADASNMEFLLSALRRFAEQQAEDYSLVFISGIELTHVAPRNIAPLSRRAKELGAGLVVVHGETLVEPVVPGTNAAAVACPDVDILSHPGLITVAEACQAAANGIYLEITSRRRAGRYDRSGHGPARRGGCRAEPRRGGGGHGDEPMGARRAGTGTLGGPAARLRKHDYRMSLRAGAIPAKQSPARIGGDCVDEASDASLE